MRRQESYSYIIHGMYNHYIAIENLFRECLQQEVSFKLHSFFLLVHFTILVNRAEERELPVVKSITDINRSTVCCGYQKARYLLLIHITYYTRIKLKILKNVRISSIRPVFTILYTRPSIVYLHIKGSGVHDRSTDRKRG